MPPMPLTNRIQIRICAIVAGIACRGHLAANFHLNKQNGELNLANCFVICSLMLTGYFGYKFHVPSYTEHIGGSLAVGRYKLCDESFAK